MNLTEAREILTQHSKSKKNGLFPPHYTHEHQLTNPICGDHVQLRFEVGEGMIRAAGFKAKACAICTASSSLLCEEVQGKRAEVAVDLSHSFERAVVAKAEDAWPEILSSLSSFNHLRVNPSRRTCALLPWIALRTALQEVVL